MVVIIALVGGSLVGIVVVVVVVTSFTVRFVITILDIGVQ